MKVCKLHIFFGLTVMLVGLLVPASGLISFLRGGGEEPDEELLLGAVLFKIGLVIIGTLVIILGKSATWRTGFPCARNPKEPADRWSKTILLIILFTTLLLRLYRLNDGFWLDEILTYVNYVKVPFGEIVTTYDSQNQHFLYSILARICILSFGQSVWAFRLPAALFGVGSVWATYLLGRQVSSTREALLSATLLMVSYHHIWFSQNGRGYTGLLFFTLVSSWLLIRAGREDRPRLWMAYGVVAALGVYVHISMVFIMMGHFIICLFFLFSRRKKVGRTGWIPLIIGFGLAALLTIQLYSFVLPQMLGGTIGHGRLVSVWKNPIWTLLEFVRGAKIGFRGVVPAILALGIFSLGVYSFSRKNPIIVGLFFIPLVVVATVAIVMGHHLWPRLFFFSFGFGVLIVARGCFEVGYLTTCLLRMESSRSVTLGTALFSLVIIVFAISGRKAYGPKQDFLGAFRFVEAMKASEDSIVTIGSTAFVYERYYETNWMAVEDVESFNNIRAAGNSTWIVYTLPAHLETEYPQIMNLVRRDFETVKKFDGTLNGGTVFIGRSKTASS